MTLVLKSGAERAYREYIKKATAPGNATLNKRTQRNERALHPRLSYNVCTMVYSQQNEIARLSGSSLNVKFSKQRRDEKTQALLELEKAQTRSLGKYKGFREHIEEIHSLREAANSKPKYKRKLPVAPFKRGISLRFLSQRTKGKVRDKCTAFHRCLGENKTFVTLTFINEVTDSIAVRILNKFLTALRKEFSRLHYVWVAERQQSGRIHFHIIINKFLQIQAYNRLWVLQQYNAGIELPGVSRDEFMLRYEESLERERLEIAPTKSNPDPIQELNNSFDVKRIKHIYGLSYYLTKYITKNENKGFNCSAWHCSRAVSKLFTKTLVSRSTFSAASSMVNSSVNIKTGEVSKAKPVIGQFHALYYIENKPYFLPEMYELEKANAWIVDGMELDDIPWINDEKILKLFSN